METQTSRWRAYVGYPVFFLVAFVLFFHLTLPWDVIGARLTDEARQKGYALSFVKVGPALGFGAHFQGVTLEPLERPIGLPADAPTPSIPIDSITARPALLPMGVHFSATAFGGELSGSVAQKGKDTTLLEVHGSNLELARAALKPVVGLDLQGNTSLDLNLAIAPDFTKTTGDIKLGGKEWVLNGGTVMGFDLPKLQMGALDIKLKFDGGKALVDAFAINGTDLEAKGEGDITLDTRPATSRAKVRIDFKLADEWLKKYSFIQMGLGQAGRPNGQGFYSLNLDGMVGNPRPTLKQ